ncbi:zinc finger CCCH domain-containing protein 40 isoform X1 [Raphanus sativus]|uniref:Zinc finger CCCH domain-containing protein 40 isoform X1 n=1 Tax=Raphanus sativus TaxID=3726 RepID=A0A6J0JDI7_RAPSA|nr:zinc finger CCCH domain-containing protein 40 isoform X1 [Raphanus sativus]
MMSGPSLYKTKLCILYEKNGHCSKPNCTFAHGAAELRLPGESSSFRGRRHNLDGDLRDKLGRHFSPERRPSLDRSGRRVQRFSGHENPRAFEKRRDVDYRENRRYDERSDYAGSRIEVRERDERNKFLGYNNVLEEQLKDVEQDVKMLTDEKLRLEAAVERKARDADSLTSKIQELRTQLDREKEECKRITSSTKKFVKEYNRFLRAQDDVKRSEARLQKLGTQLSTYLLGNEGNDMETDIEIESDEEKNGRNLRSASDLQNELQNTSSVSRKRHYVEQYTTKESVQDALIGRREEDKVENGRSPSRWNRIPSISFSEEESRARNEEDTMNKSSSKEDTRKRRRLSSGTSSSNKVMSSTSMAARVSDEVAEFDEENTREANGSPLISLPPPPPFRNAHFHGDEETKVDVIERRKADDVDSV